MSWQISYRVELSHPLTAPERTLVQTHTEHWSDQLSRFCSGYALDGQVGDRALHGSLQPSGDHRTTHDVLALVCALRELEQELHASAFISTLHEEGDEYEVRGLDLRDLEEELTAAWGDVNLGLEDDDDDDEQASPLGSSPDGGFPEGVEANLRAAREAFAHWQRQKNQTPS